MRREERSDEALRIPRAKEHSHVQRRHGRVPCRCSLRPSLSLSRRQHHSNAMSTSSFARRSCEASMVSAGS